MRKLMNRRDFVAVMGAGAATAWAGGRGNIGIFGATGMETVGSTTRTFQEGDQKLIVYSDVPGATPSEFYRIRVRSEATKMEWQSVFAHITRSLYSQAKIPKKPGSTSSMENYYDHVKDWSHTYGNIEMDSPVEIEVSRANGAPIQKAAVHPAAKAGKATLKDAKAYFAVNSPALVAVDIDGQMDDQDTGEGYNGPAIHTVSIFAHPILERPAMTDPGVVVVTPGTRPPTDPATYETLYFSAGVHDIGRNFKVHENKKYYLAGDALVYGTFNNLGAGSGKNIKIFGVGTLSGDRITHPNYDPDYLKVQKEGASEQIKAKSKEWKAICIENADNAVVEGVCVANPPNHAINLVAIPTDKAKKHTFVRWAKVISWRGNGDGIGSAHEIEDCFLRTADDCSYIKGDRRRCVFWTDVNGAVFHMAGIPEDRKIVIKDCDVIYARNKYKGWEGGRVFSQRGEGKPGLQKVNVLIRNFRIEDKRPTLQIFHLYSHDGFRNTESPHTGSSYSGITFQNITAAGKSVLGLPEILHGCKEAPWSNITFDNVVIAGKKLTSLDDFAYVNEYVTDTTFK
ncbi:MAG: endo-polygalacturonase [Candidatus Sumerlaeota bacterium]|nr:endo-polygalacturonase [Candidatus Sumerlaeota bacterium]